MPQVGALYRVLRAWHPLLTALGPHVCVQGQLPDAAQRVRRAVGGVQGRAPQQLRGRRPAGLGLEEDAEGAAFWEVVAKVAAALESIQQSMRSMHAPTLPGCLLCAGGLLHPLLGLAHPQAVAGAGGGAGGAGAALPGEVGVREGAVVLPTLVPACAGCRHS